MEINNTLTQNAYDRRMTEQVPNREYFFKKGHKVNQKSEKPLDAQLQIRMYSEEKDALKRLAEEHDLSMSDMVRFLIEKAKSTSLPQNN